MAAIGACRLRGKERERGKGKFVRWVEEEASKVHSHTEPAEGRGKGEVGGGRGVAPLARGEEQRKIGRAHV